MTIDEYAEWAAAVRPAGNTPAERLAYLALGLIGEAGELADTIRKMMREDTLDEARLVYELGDIAYHWAALCAELGQTPSALLARSQANIAARLATRQPPTTASSP